jgi:hypothetical protein
LPHQVGQREAGVDHASTTTTSGHVGVEVMQDLYPSESANLDIDMKSTSTGTPVIARARSATKISVFQHADSTRLRWSRSISAPRRATCAATIGIEQNCCLHVAHEERRTA